MLIIRYKTLTIRADFVLLDTLSLTSAQRGAGDPDTWSTMVKLNLEAPMRFTRRLCLPMVRTSSSEPRAAQADH